MLTSPSTILIHKQLRAGLPVLIWALLACLGGSGHASDSPQWTYAQNMSHARWAHAATLLPSGEVLVTGGYADDYGFASLSICERYNPTTDTWSPTAGPLATARSHHTSILLPSGLVLVAGGDNTSGGAPLSSCEVYFPGMDAWRNSASHMVVARSCHTMTLLVSGKVLVTGGRGASGILASSELYNPNTNTWSATSGSMMTGREHHTATLLPSGKVLVTGGNGVGGMLSSSELYDPATNTWSTAGTMLAAREYHTATLLLSGKVLVTGGYNYGEPTSCELYNPSTNTWTMAGSMATSRYDHTATLLTTGQVLVAGSLYYFTSELYDQNANSWRNVSAPMMVPQD